MIPILIGTAPLHLLIAIAFRIRPQLILVDVVAWLVLADALAILFSRGGRRVVEDVIVAEALIFLAYVVLTHLVPKNTPQEEKQAIDSVIETNQAANVSEETLNALVKKQLAPVATKKDVDLLRDEIKQIQPSGPKARPRRR
jgi:hypothetical protein